jgi:hypothetical protein
MCHTRNKHRLKQMMSRDAEKTVSHPLSLIYIYSASLERDRDPIPLAALSPSSSSCSAACSVACSPSAPGAATAVDAAASTPFFLQKAAGFVQALYFAICAVCAHTQVVAAYRSVLEEGIWAVLTGCDWRETRGSRTFCPVGRFRREDHHWNRIDERSTNPPSEVKLWV